MGSVFNPSSRKYYILEHKVSSKYHRAGEAQEIIVDQIELGRDSRCQVRFDDSFKTVSRHHAAIVKEDENWKLIQISKTNATLLNGRPVRTEWYLQNGDEIQLSINGPKLGFIIPTGKKATVGSIGLTRRLSLFRQQALRPYKRAIAGLASVLVLAVGGLTTWNVLLQQSLRDQSQSLANQIVETKNNKAKADSLTKELLAANEKICSTEKDLAITKTVAERALNRPIPKPLPPTPGNVDLTPCYPYTYYVISAFVNDAGALLTTNDGTPIAWSGTGFMLDNGYFVTAQHMIHWDELGFKYVTNEKGESNRVIDPDDVSTQLNYYYYAGLLSIKMICASSTDQFEITYKYTQMPFRLGVCDVATAKISDEQGRSWVVRRHNYGSGDFAVVKMSGRGGMKYDAAFSKNMPASTPLHILGFPARQGAKAKGSIAPIYSQAVTSRQGLEDDGTIKTSNDNSDHGNSGGPVLVSKNNVLTVVGILSGANKGSDSQKGRVVPIGAAFN